MKRKRMLSALLVVAMAATMFAGCGNKGGSNSSTQGGKAANDGDIKEFTAFFAVPGSEINDDNEVQQIIAEKTGVKVKETWLTGQTAEEAIGTLVAGDEYPDFICGGNGMPQLYDAGALTNIRISRTTSPNRNGISFVRTTDIFTGFHSSPILREKRKPVRITMRHSGFRQEFLSGLIIRKSRRWMIISS